ncbi:MAG: hypothetical protein JO253_02900 [Alphaproteobacteria bacterium]|nr:hypothetical protein [Alphaproteobacteria bacterium]
MRSYGRITQPDGTLSWVQVNPDANGFDDPIWLTTLAQCLKLSLNESPFYANYGIPAQRAVVQQIFPDFYVAQTQSQFAQYFASLIVAKVPNPAQPEYNINVVTHQGAKIVATVPV